MGFLMDKSILWSTKVALTAIDEFQGHQGALLPMLHRLQDVFGFIYPQAIELLANELNLSQSEVSGVVSFYHDFKKEKQGDHIIKVCRAEACQSMGANDLLSHIKARLSVDVGGTTSDGNFTLETVFCLGNCALSPSVMVNETLYGRVSPQGVAELLSAYEGGASS